MNDKQNTVWISKNVQPLPRENVKIDNEDYFLDQCPPDSIPGRDEIGFFMKHWHDEKAKYSGRLHEGLKCRYRLVVRNMTDEVVAFSAFSGHGDHGDFEFFLVHPNYRNRGLSTFMAQRSIQIMEGIAKEENTKLETVKVSAETGLGLTLCNALRKKFKDRVNIAITRTGEVSEVSNDLASTALSGLLYEPDDLKELRFNISLADPQNFPQLYDDYAQALSALIQSDYPNGLNDPEDDKKKYYVWAQIGRLMLMAAFCNDAGHVDLFKENLRECIAACDNAEDETEIREWLQELWRITVA